MSDLNLEYEKNVSDVYFQETFSIFQNFIKTTASSLYNLSNLPAMHTNTPIRED